MTPTGFEDLFTPATLAAATATLAKLGVAAVLGGLVGIDRELQRRPAGVRTHMLVCIGCALFTELSRSFDSASPDRVAAQIVTGIGFLGAGTILRNGLEIKGLTTAASIWAVAAVGMAISIGGPFFWVAILATILTLGTLRLVGVFESRLAMTGEAILTVHLESREAASALLTALTAAKSPPLSFDLQQGELGYVASVTVANRNDELLSSLASVEGLRSAEWADSH